MLQDFLKIWRWKKQYTVRQAASLLGISAATYSRIEAGKKMDSDTMLKLIAVLFGSSKC